MAKESTIVDLINIRMASALQAITFNGHLLRGIVYSIVNNSETGEVLSFPLVANEGADITYSDKAPIQIHHRHLSNIITTGTDKILTDAADMRLYITAQRSRVNLSNDALKDFICSQLVYDLTPAERTTLNIRSGTVQFTGADMNSMRLFQQEYGKALTRTDIIMIEVQYKIECRYTAACINDLCYDDN